MDTEICKAVIEQGKQKGHQCTRPSLENGYCGKHSKQAVLKSLDAGNKKKCLTYRCIILLEINKEDVYCEECKVIKKEKLKTKKICIATIQTSKSEKQCDKIASCGEFCGKHNTRNTLLQSALQKGIRICDDAKRSCKNTTVDNKLKCEVCLEKIRENDRKEYQVRQLDSELCLGCGITIIEPVQGLRKEIIKRCKECYEKLKRVEEQRNRTDRDYNKERKQNLMKHYNEYVRSATLRNIQFSLDANEFEGLVNLHCYYCDTYDKDKVIGIDRKDSLIGYKIDNVVPCCSICNHLKGEIPFNEFIEVITKIYNNIVKKNKDFIEPTHQNTSSYIRTKKILEYYKNGNFTDYIEICIKDNRSPLLLENLQKLSKNKMSDTEFINYIKAILRSEANSNLKTNSLDRHRIPKKILYEYFENSKKDEVVKLYEDVHGKIEGFVEDVDEVSKKWSSNNANDKQNLLDKLIIKYQNKRNR